MELLKISERGKVHIIKRENREIYITNYNPEMLTAWDANMEAVYKIIPSFTLKDSNITCVFVATGFPKNRSKFFYKSLG